MIKAAFFDIDGTLISFNTHKIPDSTWAALHTMRERGIKLIISSGRPTYQLPDFIATGFDAYITLNGQLCYDEAGVFRSNPINPHDVETIVEQVRQGLYDVLVLQRERSFANNLSSRVVETASAAGLVYPQDNIERTFDAPVYQFCAFIDPEDDHILLDATSDVKTTRWTNLFCDVVPATGGKQAGVEAVFERLGIAPDEAIAFGDGENDVSMFGSVGESVAMGNAWDIVKNQATYITDDVDHDGIYNACKHFGLI